MATEVRGEGLIQGLQLTIDPSHIIDRVRAHGVLIISCGDKVLRFVPPLNIPRDDLVASVNALKKAFAELTIDLKG